MKAMIVRFIRDEQGQDLVEYALIVAAVGLALITTVNQLSQGRREPVSEHHGGPVEHRHRRPVTPDGRCAAGEGACVAAA